MKNKLFLSLGEYGNLMSTIEAKRIDYINDGQFVNADFTFDEEKLIELLKGVNEIAYIDIEEPYLNYLENSPINSIEFQSSFLLFFDVIRFCKSKRPDVKFGYYGIPFTSYWNRTTEFYAKNQKIAELIEECDYLFPSIYTFYDEHTDYIAFENKRYLSENASEAVKLGKQFGKPVLPFVMHRFHPSNATFGMAQIPESTFLRDIDLINKTGVDGIVWWSADDYFFRQKEAGVIKEFAGTPEQYKIFNDKILFNKATKIQNLLNYVAPIIVKKRCWIKRIFNIK